MGASSTIYLDHAAAVPVLPEVLRAHEELCQTHFANPHATSALSNKSRFAVERAGCRLLELLSIPEGAAQVVWTSGGTEALNLGVLGFLRAGGGTGACLLDPLAHPAVSNPGAHFARDGGTTAELRLRGTELGREIPDGVLPEPVRLVAVTQVNNEIGLEYDLPGLRDWMRHHTPQAALLVDAIQSFGKLDVPWHEADIALLGISGRKIGGPASVGALVIRRGVRLEPLLYGGGQQEGLRLRRIGYVLVEWCPLDTLDWLRRYFLECTQI